MKARNKSSKASNTPSVNSSNSKRKLKSTQVKDTIPLTIENLALYFDWRQTSLAQAPTLYKIASCIWQYIEYTKMEHYCIDFGQTESNKVVELGALSSPPTIVTTSPKGDLLIMVEIMKKMDDYSEKQFLLILYPNNTIDNIQYIGDNTVKNTKGDHC